MTPFTEWLSEELRVRGWNHSQFAAYMDRRSQTVSAWFNEDRVPKPDACTDIARVLHLDPQEVIRRAYPDLALAEERAPYDALPDWTRLLPMLSQEDARYVGRLVERLAQNPAQPDPPPDPEAPR